MSTEFIKSNYKIDKKNNIIITGLSVTGEKNKKAKSLNQDSFGIELTDKIALISVADGLGSCKNSHIGSKYAIECLTEWFLNDFQKYKVVSNEMLTILNNKIIDRWKSKLSLVDYYTYDTTILYAIYTQDQLIIGGIGDGMILCFYNQDTQNFSWDKSEFSNNTVSIASIGAKELIKSQIISIKKEGLPLTVLLMTDGISDDLNEYTKDEFPKYLNSKLNSIGIEKFQNELIEWVLNWKTQGHTDDRTLCMLNINKEL